MGLDQETDRRAGFKIKCRTLQQHKSGTCSTLLFWRLTLFNVQLKLKSDILKPISISFSNHLSATVQFSQRSVTKTETSSLL